MLWVTLKELWEEESQYFEQRKELARRKAVGDQRRRWRVKLYNDLGKPIKKQGFNLTSVVQDANIENEGYQLESLIASIDSTIQERELINYETLCEPMVSGIRKFFPAGESS